VSSDETTTPPIIRLAGVHKGYGQGKGRQQVLRDVSLDILPGDLVALVGQSGSGKSTLLNIIGGLDRPDQGIVEVDGRETSKLSDARLAHLRNRRIGFIFQSFHLLDHLSCLENVALPAFFGTPPEGGTTHRAQACLDRVGLGDLAHRRPNELSGGQKQRIAIARALFYRPAILLCDEPTGNLDSETGREVIRFFQKINEEDGVTLLIVTHEERVSRAARRVLRIVDGRIVAEEHGGGVAPNASTAVQP
jgi:putative ABC transport system ATP-binding protein